MVSTIQQIANHTTTILRSFATRADQKDANLYSVPLHKQHVIAITGILDADGFTLSIHVAAQFNDEHPIIKQGSGVRPQGQTVRLTVTVSNLTAGKEYELYYHSIFAHVQAGGFKRETTKASKVWSIKQVSPGTSCIFVDHAMSLRIIQRSTQPSHTMRLRL